MVKRLSYRDALRVRGLPPLPPYAALRTRKDGDGEQREIFTPIGERPVPEVFV